MVNQLVDMEWKFGGRTTWLDSILVVWRVDLMDDGINTEPWEAACHIWDPINQHCEENALETMILVFVCVCVCVCVC